MVLLSMLLFRGSSTDTESMTAWYSKLGSSFGADQRSRFCKTQCRYRQLLSAWQQHQQQQRHTEALLGAVVEAAAFAGGIKGAAEMGATAATKASEATAVGAAVAKGAAAAIHTGLEKGHGKTWTRDPDDTCHMCAAKSNWCTTGQEDLREAKLPKKLTKHQAHV